MTGSCCSKRIVIAAIAVAVLTWAFDFLVHGNLLTDLYTASADKFRPMEDMQSLWGWCIAYHLAMAWLVAGGYYCWRKHVTVGAVGSPECPYRKSMGYGIWVGLLLGLPQVMAFVWMPLPFDLPFAWAASELVKWVLASLLLAKLYRSEAA